MGKTPVTSKNALNSFLKVLLFRQKQVCTFLMKAYKGPNSIEKKKSNLDISQKDSCVLFFFCFFLSKTHGTVKKLNTLSKSSAYFSQYNKLTVREHSFDV